MSMNSAPQANCGEKSWLATALLSFFLGSLGIHRFYTGYILIGIVQLLTIGGCGIWAFIDLIMILLNKFQDAKGQPLEGYNTTVVFVLVAVWLLLMVAGILMNVLGVAAALV